MTNTTISKTDLDFATDFITQYLRDSGYDGSLDDGTGLYDLVIRGFSTLYTLVKGDTDTVRAYLSLAEAIRQESTLDTEFDTVIDSILSNWFVSRKLGSKTTGPLRLFFTRTLPSLSITTTNATFTIGASDFVPIQDYVFAELNGDFTTVFNTTENVNEYYVEINVESEENVAEVVVVGDTVTSIISNVYFKRAEVVSTFDIGEGLESSEDFITRTDQVITTRELITDRSIRTVLLEEIDNLDNVYVAGYGDAEQNRDIQTFDSIVVHVGNKADIYLYGTYETADLTTNLVANIAEFTPENLVAILKVYELTTELIAEATTDTDTLFITGAFANSRVGDIINNITAEGSSVIDSITSDDEVELSPAIVGQIPGDLIDLETLLDYSYEGIPSDTAYTAISQAAGETTVVTATVGGIEDDVVAAGYLVITDITGAPDFYTLRYSSWSVDTFTLAQQTALIADTATTETFLALTTTAFAVAQPGDLIRNTTAGGISYIKEIITSYTAELTSAILGQAVSDNIEINTLPIATTTSDTINVWNLTGEENFGTYNQTYKILTTYASNDNGEVNINYLGKVPVANSYDLITATDNRVVCYDPIVRSMYTSVLDIIATVIYDTETNRAPADMLAEAEAYVVSYVSNLELGEAFAVSGVINAILENVEGIVSVSLPVTITYEIVDPYDLTLSTGSVTDLFIIPSMGGNDQVTWNTLQFYTDLDLVSVTEAS